MTASANAEEHSEKADAAVKPGKKTHSKKIAVKKNIKTAQSEKPKAAKITQAVKSLHAKDHPAIKSKLDKGAAGSE